MAYRIELNKEIKSFKCSHCGEQSKTVWGWVFKDDQVHAAYFVNLMTGHHDASARFTISVGGWGEEDELAERRWIFIEARATSISYEMMVREPEESLYRGKRVLGTPLTRSEALASPLIQEYFAMADHIAFNDPAVKSYLIGEHVSSEGRNG